MENYPWWKLDQINRYSAYVETLLTWELQQCIEMIERQKHSVTVDVNNLAIANPGEGIGFHNFPEWEELKRLEAIVKAEIEKRQTPAPTAKPGSKGKEEAPAELPTLESIYDGDLMELWQNISGMDNPLVSAKGDYIPKSKKRVSEVSALAQALIVLGKTKGHSFDDVCRALFVFWKEDAPKRIRPGGYAFDDALSYFTKMIK